MKLLYAILVVAFSAPVAQAAPIPPSGAREQNVYYHLHQTYELMELSKRDGCSNARDLIKHHLREAELELRLDRGSAFSAEYRQLASAASSLKRIPLQKVERLRRDIQAKAELEGLRHQREWHYELGDCSANTR